MEKRFQTDVVRKIWENQEGVYLEVAPDDDGLECVVLRTVDEASKNYYGDINLMIPKELALLLGQALIDATKDTRN